MQRRISVYVTEKGKAALDKIAAFNPEKEKRGLLSALIVEAAAKYKGMKPPKQAKAAAKPAAKKSARKPAAKGAGK